MSPRISVIVPVYNRADLVGETLECMLRQTLAPHELFVVDDGSTDDSAAVVRSFGDRVTLIEQANAGPGSARNNALARATGDFVQFFDSDDLATHDKLECQAKVLVESNADIAYGAWTRAWFDGDRVRVGRLVLQQRALPDDALSAFLRRWVMFMPAALIRRTLLTKVGGFPTEVRTGEDLELMLRLTLAGGRFVHAPGPLLLIRQHPERQISAAADLAPMRAQDRIWLIARVEAMLAQSGVRIRARDRLMWQADRWSARRHHTGVDLAAEPVGFHPLHAAILRARELSAGLRARTGGTRESRLYGAGPMTESQRAAVRALGYEPSSD